MTKTWSRSAAGQPHGALTVFAADEKPIGHIIAGGGADRAGTSEVAGSGISGNEP